MSDDLDSDDDEDYSEDDEHKHDGFGGEVRGSRTNCKGHWTKEEVFHI